MKLFPLVLTIVVVMSSCKKEEPVICEPPVENGVDFNMPSKPGSWWVYERFNVDSNGVEVAAGYIDTLHLVGDSIINGNTFQQYYYSNTGLINSHFRRDSSGYIIDQWGTIHYAHVDFGDIFYASWSAFPGANGSGTISNRSYMVDDLSNPTIVPAGTFNCVIQRLRIEDSLGLAINECGDTYEDFDAYYASDIGMIKRNYAYFTTFINQCAHIEERLIDYYIP